MPKLFVLLLMVVLCLASLSGYLFLSQKIATGRQQIVEGEQQIKAGEQKLANGKGRLSNGKRKLSTANAVYGGVSHVPFMGVVKSIPVAGAVFGAAGQKISQGNAMVAAGEIKVKAGEARLAAGKLALGQGKERLNLANTIRFFCGLGAIVFALIAVGFWVYWRKKSRR